MTTHIEQERPDDFDALEQELYRHQPVLSMHDGSIAGCQCMDRVFYRRTEDWGTHLAEVFLTLQSTRPEPPVTDAECLAALNAKGNAESTLYESASDLSYFTAGSIYVMRAVLEAARATREGAGR